MRLFIFQMIVFILGALLIEGPLNDTQFFRDFSETWWLSIVDRCFPIATMAAGFLLNRLPRGRSTGLTTGHFELRWFAEVEATAAESELFPKRQRRNERSFRC